MLLLQAKKYFKYGAEKGDPRCAYNYAVLVIKENPLHNGRQEAWTYLRKASDADIQKVKSIFYAVVSVLL